MNFVVRYQLDTLTRLLCDYSNILLNESTFLETESEWQKYRMTIETAPRRLSREYKKEIKGTAVYLDCFLYFFSPFLPSLDYKYLIIFIFRNIYLLSFSSENNFSFEYVLFVVANTFSVLFIEWQREKSALVNWFFFADVSAVFVACCCVL